MTPDEISNLLCDLRDIRNILPPKVLNQPKDADSEFTIGDLLDDAIELLEGAE